MVRYGIGSYCGIGLVDGYTTNGDNTDIEDYYRVEDGSVQLQTEQGIVSFTDLADYDQTIESQTLGQQKVSGSLTLRPSYDQLHRLLRMVTGHAPAVSGGADPYLWSFVPVDPNSSSHYLSGSTVRHAVIEVYRSDSGGNSIFYQGCIPTEVTFNFEPNAFVEVTINFIGRGYTVGTKSASPTFGSDYVKGPTGQLANSFLKMGTEGAEAGYRCGKASLTISEPKEHRWDVGDKNPSVIPAITGPREVSLNVEIESDGALDSDTTLMAVLASPIATRFDSVVLSVVKQLAPGPGDRTLIFNLYNCVIQPGGEPTLTGHGLIKLNLDMKAHAGTTLGLSDKATSYVVAMYNGVGTY